MAEASTPNPALGNLPELSVSELSFALKKSIEDTFGYVRVRGELGRVSRPGSGHIYLDLKDDKAVLNGVIWKGVSSRLRIQPEQGLEVVCTGKLTTFPGQSRYQIVIDSMEPAGVGALMALLEERRKKLAKERLFAEERKQDLPYLPKVIGVVTSPTGAVIQDILHRLEDRFPRHVLIAPVLVQGEKAAGQIAEAIQTFNAIEKGGPIPRPDVLIVARGGGSIEDLWAFNEEEVVRAAAKSAIPLISAVGHETDTTLIDYAADRRAPTPTAAAEMAVPVRTDLVGDVLNLERRLLQAGQRGLENRRHRIDGLARGLPRLQELLALPQQRYDTAASGLLRSLKSNLERHQIRLASGATQLRLEAIRNSLGRADDRVQDLARRQSRAFGLMVERGQSRLDRAQSLLSALSYENVLERGFALIRTTDGEVIVRKSGTKPGLEAIVQFADGTAEATFTGSKSPKKRAKAPKKPKKSDTKVKDDPQGRLL